MKLFVYRELDGEKRRRNKNRGEGKHQDGKNPSHYCRLWDGPSRPTGARGVVSESRRKILGNVRAEKTAAVICTIRSGGVSLNDKE